MATRFSEFASLESDLTEIAINECFDELVLAVDRRRDVLLAEYRSRRDEMRAKETGRTKARNELLESKAQLHDTMAENILHSLREKINEDIETQMKKLEITGPPVELIFQCEPRDFEERISQLGQLVQRQVVLPIPNYPALRKPRISVCKPGIEPGQLSVPGGIAHSETGNLIFVADGGTETHRICVFSEEGEYINSFGQEQLQFPIGVAVNEDKVYVSDSMQNAILLFTRPEYELVLNVGKKGFEENEFSSPRRISVSSNGDVYVADEKNNRVVVMDCELSFKQFIQHSTMTRPKDVKLCEANEVVYVVSNDSPCLHLFDTSGSKLRSFINRGEGVDFDVVKGYCFCFDKQNNILIGDYNAGCIKVFSPAGTLLKMLGTTKKKFKKVKPLGISVAPNNKIVCSSYDTKYSLHIFY